MRTTRPSAAHPAADQDLAVVEQVELAGELALGMTVKTRSAPSGPSS